MANAKLNLKTPLAPLSWVTVRGTGKLKMNAEDNQLPENYNYTATATLTKAQADKFNASVDKFWKENKPKGCGKKKFEVIKEEFRKVLDADGKPKLDADDEPIKEATGNYTIQAKTLTHWPKDGKQNLIKLLGSNGKPLPEGHGLEEGCGQGTMGIIHLSLGISSYPGNEGVVAYLNGVQIKESTYAEFAGGSEVDADEIEDDVADADVESSEDEKPEV